jgi:hypothetical protein
VLGRTRGRLSHGFDCYLDVDPFPDDNAAAVQREVPGESEVTPIDARRRRQSDAFIP